MSDLGPRGTISTRSWRRRAVAGMVTVFLSFGPFLIGRSHAVSALSTQSMEWKRFDVKIIARGSHVGGGIGSMDSYLALVSGRNRAETVARLVHYYPSFETGILDQRIMSGRAFHLWLTPAGYCGMDTRDFAVKRVFDSDAVAKVEGPLPCFLVRE